MPVADIDYREYFPPEKLAELQQTFDYFDSSGDGSIGPDELYQMFKKLGKSLSKSQSREIMKEVDTDGSGEIEFEELCILEIKMSNPRPRADLIKYEDYLEPKLITRLEDHFVRQDVACKGTISVAEVKSALQAAGCSATEDEIEDVVTDVDKTGSGSLEFAQFAAAWAVVTKARRRVNYREFLASAEVAEMRTMFHDADSNGTGEISAAELDQLFRKMGFPLKTKQLKALLRDFDTDGSGEISFEEFCVMMLRLKGARRMRKISPATYECRDLWLNEKFTVKELHCSGYTVENMKAAGIPVGQILATGDTSALEMRRCGYTAAELRKGGMGANELRVSGFSLSELRTAGFSNVILSQTNRVLRKCLSTGNLSVLPQQNPALNPRQLKSAMYRMMPSKWSNVPKAVTPRIREHTDWKPAVAKPSRVRTAPARPNFGPLDLPDLPGRPMTADH
eukprot:TRINITY_DN102137_c0_g1_i1.p1 TRINITY_DN102137_c0_g1~~TRINITY_DN102137_c0_g1_i1.p1  ORF type:complete len:452 (-),score=89.38 TRINITY_DN102137_c0_g1_i1:21-1376(-)